MHVPHHLARRVAGFAAVAGLGLSSAAMLGVVPAGAAVSCGNVSVTQPTVSSPAAGKIRFTNVRSSTARTWTVKIVRANGKASRIAAQKTGPNVMVNVTFTGLASGSNWSLSAQGVNACDTQVLGGSIRVR